MADPGQPQLQALTPEAEQALGGERLDLTTLPFRVGRECRMVVTAQGLQVQERRRSAVRPNNDLYLQDTGQRLNVSRAHFQIEHDGQAYLLVDRGSALGTYVGSTRVGGHDAGGSQALQNGDIIVVGSSESPFVFRFLCDQ